MSCRDSWDSTLPKVCLQLYFMFILDSSKHPPEPLNSRSSAREKLTRLTKQQFQELSTDVYDELIRRNNNTVGNEGELPDTPRGVHVFTFNAKFRFSRSGTTSIPREIKPDRSSLLYQRLVLEI